MCEALSKKEIDCALLLTEGAVKYCFEKKEARLHSVYVSSPLVWGVHAGGKSAYSDFASVSKKNGSDKPVVFAISRFGSGSHLMAFVLAKQMGWKNLKFEVVGTLKGAREYLEKHPDTLFMWEKAMTAPLVAEGVFKRVGETPTPWPCFVLACREGLDTKKLDVLVKKVKGECLKFKLDRTGSVDAVVKKFGIKRDLVEEWFDRLTYTCERGFNKSELQMLDHVKATLIEVGQLAETFKSTPASEICLPPPTSSPDPRSKL